MTVPHIKRDKIKGAFCPEAWGWRCYDTMCSAWGKTAQEAYDRWLDKRVQAARDRAGGAR